MSSVTKLPQEWESDSKYYVKFAPNGFQPAYIIAKQWIYSKEGKRLQTTSEIRPKIGLKPSILTATNRLLRKWER